MTTTVPGTLFIIAAPSGAGKTSLVRALVKTVLKTVVSISHTTRPMRDGEIDGEHYHFVDEKTFKTKINENEFLEHAMVYGYYYGTSKIWVENKLNQGFDVILEIDWQGAQQVRRLFVNCVNIFILPPSATELLRRLRQRAQDDGCVISKRMALASNQVSHYKEFDYLLINADFDQALQELTALVIAQRLLRSQQEMRYADIIQELLTARNVL